MEKEELEKNNKLIMEFLGYEYKIYNYNQPGDHDYYWWFPKGVYDFGRKLSDSDLMFDLDWNWLMRIVEKIESLEEVDRNRKDEQVLCTPYRVDILGRNIVEVLAFGEDSIYCTKSETSTKIQEVYVSCLEFIKWYNKKSENMKK